MRFCSTVVVLYRMSVAHWLKLCQPHKVSPFVPPCVVCQLALLSVHYCELLLADSARLAVPCCTVFLYSTVTYYCTCVVCQVGVLLDVPLVRLTLLDIRGALKFQDDSSTPTIEIQASFVLVQGRLTIGTPSQQFRQKATITLTPNPNGRAPYAYTSNSPADTQYPRDFGHKAFVVVGGQVDLHGLPATPDMPVWIKLVANAYAGDRTIVVKGDVSGWPIGAPIVVAPTDYFPDQEDVAVLTQKTKLGSDTWQLSLAQGLQFNHFGDAWGVPDGFGGYIDEAAEVGIMGCSVMFVIALSYRRQRYGTPGSHHSGSALFLLL